jgi:hypothetical protein
VIEASEIRIPANGVRSLVWDGESLVDWVSGGERYFLSGETSPAHARYAYPFDAVASLTGSSFSVIYTRTGTKGLVLRNGEVIRELNRSFYHADVYEYPVVLFRLPSGREVLAHCPDDYCRLEIEDVATGEVLTKSTSRKPIDVFHSRLAVSPDGRYLLSAGWLWHPIDNLQLYDIGVALEDPAHLDDAGTGLNACAEESSATFLPDGRLVIALRGKIDSEDVPSNEGELRTFDPKHPDEAAVLSSVGRLGAIAAIGSHHLLAMYGHPRLIDAHNGVEVLSWPKLKSGTQTSSILMSKLHVPVIAVDCARQRFALAHDRGITVVECRVRP